MMFGLLAATGITDSGAHERSTAPVVIVGSAATHGIAVLSLADGLPVLPLRQVDFSTAQVRTFAVTPAAAFAVAPDEEGATFRIIRSDGRDLWITEPTVGAPQTGAARGDHIALVVDTNRGVFFRRFNMENDTTVTGAPEDSIALKPGAWIWRVSPAGIFALSLTDSGTLQTVYWAVAANEVSVGAVAAPNLGIAGGWLDLYDAQFSADGSRVFISAEWGIDSGGPSDRADTLIVYDPARAEVIRSYAFWSADPAEPCPDGVYVVVGDSMARVRGDNGEKCGSRAFGDPGRFRMDPEGNHYFSSESTLSARKKTVETDGIMRIPLLFSPGPEGSQAAIGMQGPFIWFSWMARRPAFRGKHLEHIPSGMAGAYDSASGRYWLFDARGEHFFKGVSADCASACGLWSRVLDRLPAERKMPPFSEVGPEWRLAIDYQTGLPCLALVTGQKARTYRLIDRRGEFPYSPTQEWDYTGMFRTITYRTPAGIERLAERECTSPASDETAPKDGGGITGSLQWVGGSEDHRLWLIAILENEGKRFRRVVGLRASEVQKALESATFNPTRDEAAAPDIAFSLEGEDFALEPLSVDHFVLRRTYTAYPRSCLSRAPVRWTDIYEIRAAEVAYSGSRVADEGLPDDPCIRREVAATLASTKSEKSR